MGCALARAAAPVARDASRPFDSIVSAACGSLRNAVVISRVFISSVMRDFESERAAIRTAVESLRLIPVMAETFGAKPFSPRLACLDVLAQVTYTLVSLVNAMGSRQRRELTDRRRV